MRRIGSRGGLRLNSLYTDDDNDADGDVDE
jgi:hypothetical protein